MIADEARETRGNYGLYKQGDKTKTSNAAISEAAHQVALATRSIVDEEDRFSVELGRRASADVSSAPMPYQTQLFIPAIVTSARIYVCEFNPEDVDAATGEIARNKATIKEQHFLVYEYPLPRSLQVAPANLGDALASGALELFSRMHILIVHSRWLDEILNTLTFRIRFPGT